MEFPDWTDQTVYIVAAGQSAAEIVPHIPRARVRVVVVNRSHELVPDADVLYAADTGFWQIYKAAREFKGRKFCPDEKVKRICAAVEVVEIRRDSGCYSQKMIREPPGLIGGGGNSGFQAVNLAAQWGPQRICLVGFDYRGKHWHPDHPPGLRNPGDTQLRAWALALDRQAVTLAGWGIEVLNLSRHSALRGFPRVDCRLPYPAPATLPA